MAIPSTETDVLIVGGGPSGLVSALLLAKVGVRTIVLERNRRTDAHPKAHELNARSMEILREVGILEDELAMEASPIEDASRILFCRTINEEIGRIDLLDDPARKDKYDTHLRQTLPYLNLSQSELENVLVAHVEANPLIELHFSACWESFEEVPDGVKSRATIAGHDCVVHSKYLLGCDGASSRVRRAMGIAMEGPQAIQSFVNAYFQLNLREKVSNSAKLYWILHPEFAGTLVAHHMEKRWVYAVPVQEPWEKSEDFTVELMKERIQGALGFRLPDLEISSLSTWHMTAQVAESYRCGRAFLVGDAAHRFPPTGGLGMNTGIGDAHNLCWKLAMVLRGTGGEPLLDTYESERRPIAQKNCGESHENFEKIFEVIEAVGLDMRGIGLLARLMNSPPVRWMPERVRHAIRRAVTYPARRIVGRALRDGPQRARVASAIANQVNHFDRLGLDIGYVYESGALIGDGRERLLPDDVVSQYLPITNPGARLPHAWIESDGEVISTHDALSFSRFTLLVPEGRLENVVSSEALQVVEMDGFPSSIFSTDYVLLVRPDGHIAWRYGVDELNTESLASAMNCIVSRPLETQPT